MTAVSQRRVQTDVPLVAVTGLAVPGGRLRRFEAQGEIGAAEGMKATLIVQGLPFQVEIISVFGSVVTLSTPAEMPMTNEATLRTDLSWLLNEQSKRLSELVNGGPGFNAVAALAAVTPPDAGAPGTSHFHRAPLASIRVSGERCRSRSLMV
ncbi:hypothetical protein ACFQ0B_23790 [Nonomuraea thailandensis]